MTTEDLIKSQINNNDVILYMKGNPHFPQCGFSAKVAAILKHLKVKFAYVNILENPDIRATLPKIAMWPTFPQLYVKGNLIGGCDIVSDMFEKGELITLMEENDVIKEHVEFYSA